MQRIPDEPLRLTFFDDALSYQHLRDLHRVYTGLLETDPAAGLRYLESYLLSVAVGVKAVHHVRKVDAEFMTDFMLPQLEEDELIGEIAGRLARGDGQRPGAATPAGLATDEDDDDQTVDVKGLIDTVTRRDKRVEVPGTNFHFEQDDVREALNSAVSAGIKVKRSTDVAANKLDAPAGAVKTAAREVTKAHEAYKEVAETADFDQRRRKSLEVAFNRLRRSLNGLERQLAKDKVLGA